MKQYNKGNDRNKGFQGRNGRSDRRRDIRDTPLNRMEETILATMRSEEIHDWSARQLLKKAGVLDKLAFYDALRSLKDRRMIYLTASTMRSLFRSAKTWKRRSFRSRRTSALRAPMAAATTFLFTAALCRVRSSRQDHRRRHSQGRPRPLRPCAPHRRAQACADDRHGEYHR